MSNESFKILIADGDKSARECVQAALANGPFRCQITGEFSEAQELMANTKFDAVLIDLILHGGSGGKLALTVAKSNSPPLVYVSSPQVELVLGRELLRAGVKEMIYKPHELALLKRKLSAAVLDCRNDPAFQNAAAE